MIPRSAGGRETATRIRLPFLAIVACLALPVAAYAQNHPPVADAGPDQTAYTGEIVLRRGSATSPDGTAIVGWSWAVVSAPAGGTWNLDYADRPTAQFLPLSPGDYVLSLSVVDANANFSAPAYTTVHAHDNLRPVAVATADKTIGPAPLTVCFDGSQSYDPEGAPLIYDWDLGDGVARATTPTVCPATGPKWCMKGRQRGGTLSGPITALSDVEPKGSLFSLSAARLQLPPASSCSFFSRSR